jgi:hypothetical protein
VPEVQDPEQEEVCKPVKAPKVPLGQAMQKEAPTRE